MKNLEVKHNADKVKALTESTIAECRQQGFTISDAEDFLTQLQIEILQRKEEVRKESAFLVR